MTILYILISTDPTGGATKSFLTLLRGVLASGNHAIVVLPDSSGICSTLRNLGVVVWVVPSRPNVWTDSHTFKQKMLFVPRQIGRIVLNWWAERRILKLAAGSTIDMVHSNNTTTSLGRFIAKKRHIPHIYHIREYGDLDFGLTYFPSNRSFYRLLHTENVYSICITRDIQKHFGLTNLPSSRVIYNGIIPHSSAPADVHTPRTFFLYAGRLERTKGLLDLIDAYHTYTQRVESPLPLHIAGEAIDPVYEQEVKQRVQYYDLTDRVAFLGNVTDMDTLYAHALATIIPSYSEGFGRCMPEAMVHGSIAIGRDSGGTREQLDNGLTLANTEIGLRFSTIPELTDCLTRVHTLSDTDRQRLTDNAYRCVSALYSIDTYVQTVLDFYQNII